MARWRMDEPVAQLATTEGQVVNTDLLEGRGPPALLRPYLRAEFLYRASRNRAVLCSASPSTLNEGSADRQVNRDRWHQIKESNSVSLRSALQFHFRDATLPFPLRRCTACACT